MTAELLIYILVMAVTTYLIRMLPFTLFRKRIESTFLKSFFYYIPYAVLGAMTIPWVFYSTGSFAGALAGTVCAFILAYFNRSLIVVALASCASAYAEQLIISLCI